MEVNILHFYPDLMNLYGSYANVALMKRTLERMGCTVTVETVEPGGKADIARADVLFMGAGTERRQKAALADLLRFADAVKDAAAQGKTLLFCGTAMELLGRRITDCGGAVYEGLALAGFETVQGSERMVEDVYAATPLYDAPVVGFMNKCSVITGVTSPLLTNVRLGFGNEGAGGDEGFHENNVFASELTGPILVKNPELLRTVLSAVYARRGETMPTLPPDEYLLNGYAVTARELKNRCRA